MLGQNESIIGDDKIPSLTAVKSSVVLSRGYNEQLESLRALIILQ